MPSSGVRAPPAHTAASRPLGTIFSQGERAAPAWYAALGIPQAGARACPFWVVSRPAPPARSAGRDPRSPCRAGRRAPRPPAGPRPGARPAHRLGFLLWPVCVRVTEGREMEKAEGWAERGREGEMETEIRTGTGTEHEPFRWETPRPGRSETGRQMGETGGDSSGQ